MFKIIDLFSLLFDLGVDLYNSMPIVGDIEATTATNNTPKKHTL